MSSTLFHGRPAWQIESEEIRVTIMQCGGHIAETTNKRTGVNPLWIQDRPTIDADQYDRSVHGPIYGDDPEGKLISGLLGHNLCVPYWGNPSGAEYDSGMTCHGEANVIRWREQGSAPGEIALDTILDESGLCLRRTLRCVGPILHFETTVENLLSLDRPLAWCEHVTLGPPFLSAEETVFVANLGRGYKTTADFNNVFLWPEGHGQRVCNLSRFSRQPHSDLVNSFLVEGPGDYGYFAAWNTRLGSLFGYIFSARDFHWLNVWENNDQRRKTRAMEFSNTPIEGSMKQLFALPKVLGHPTFEWLNARASLSKRFFSFTLAIPSSYEGVESVYFDGRTLQIRETATGSEVAIGVG